jgi:hypothetical protein
MSAKAYQRCEKRYLTLVSRARDRRMSWHDGLCFDRGQTDLFFRSAAMETKKGRDNAVKPLGCGIGYLAMCGFVSVPGPG